MMEKTYAPEQIEQQWYQTWEQSGYFKPSEHGESYCMMLPPPNVTGSLHMGHGFGFTLMDILIRYQRMAGKNVLWQPGTDHAGIATQMVVEQRLLAEGLTKQELGRDAFIEKIWQWKNESGGNITRQLRRLGASLDWSRERFTMDESLSKTVREVFIRLYDEGLIYRGTRLVNWDPKLQTAISDLEAISQEEEGKLWHIRYPLVNSTESIIVATTRPETLLGDVAVAVHPDDRRYQHLIGQQVQLPLTNRTIPIVADDFVTQDFGSGCVKITPAHDFNDYALGKRHGLTPINIFTKTATLNDNAPAEYQGLDRFVAREKILADLDCLGLITKIEKHILKVPRSEKSNAIVEPYLTEQWFMKMATLAEPAIAAVKNKEIRFIPETWEKTYFQWLENIEDWCISRQLWWGHRIPVWYDESENIYVGEDEADVRTRYKLAADLILRQENDVLDTWFSSALWPFSTLGWPEKTTEFASFYPTSVLATGFDIIFFWVARMIMLGLKFTGKVPFKDVFITGLIRDAEGHKMSKSKGNVLDPIDLIDGISLDDLLKKRTTGLMQPSMTAKITKATNKQFPEGIASYGTDALRFTFCSQAGYGREIRFDLGRLAGYRNFCNKLWNANRYVLMNCENDNFNLSDKKLSLADQWILSRLQQTIATIHQALNSYRFDLYAQAIYEFTWNEFCDWYLELSKPVLNSANSTPAEILGTKHTLLTVLECILRLLHPITPFITEEIWQKVAPLLGCDGKTIMLQSFPQVDSAWIQTAAELELNWVKDIIIAIRTMRSEMNIPPSKMITVLFKAWPKAAQKRFLTQQNLIVALTKIDDQQWLTPDAPLPEAVSGLVGELEILIPMAGLINKAEETAKLTREITKLTLTMESAASKLQNQGFVDRAPPAVVAKEKQKIIELEATILKLNEQLVRIAKM